MVKSVFISFFCLWAQLSYANTYYVKSSGSTGSGLDDENAWSFAKLLQTNISGHTVLFKRGDVFYGALAIENSNYTLGAYGEGANPVLSGLTELTSWTLSKEHIYYVTLDVSALNLVTLDGIVKGKGRYPNKGYLPYTSHNGNSSITGTSIGGLPFIPSGGEVVIRKERWILDRHTISSASGNTIQYLTDKNNGNNDAYKPVDGNGYFIQNHLGTLDQEGEWYYDTANRRLYMHFGTGTPADRTVKASTLERNLTINSQSNITINNLDFEGSNTNGVYLVGARNITFNSCTFTKHGLNGLYGIDVSTIKVNGGSFIDLLNNGIWVEYQGKDIAVTGVSVLNAGIIPGAGRSGDTAQEGIAIYGNGIIIQKCSVVNTGYNGINFSGGNDILIENNFVDTFCSVKDDGAGIYTDGSAGSNRRIRKNIILNAIGCYEGAESNYWEAYGKAAGIYLDGGTSDTYVESNVIANGNWGGIFANGNKDHQIKDNLVYNFEKVFLVHSYSGLTVRNLKVTGNTFIAKTASQSPLFVHLFFNDNPTSFGVFDNNTYAKPIDDNNEVRVYQQYAGGSDTSIPLAKWKSDYSQDLNSSKSMVTTDKEDNMDFFYNFSEAEVTIPLHSFYADVAGKTYTSQVKIPAYGGIVLIKTQAIDFVQSVNSGNWTDPSVWSSGHVPKASESVKINQGHIIKVQQDISTKGVQVSAGGELIFLGDYKVNN
jgi:hypothetical protein